MNFVGRFDDQPLPPRIDKSLMQTWSGAQQTQVMAALQALGLISEAGEVQPALRALADGDPDQRKRLVGDLVRTHYKWALDLSSVNATQQQLDEAFRERGVAGSTARKAATFFLHAAKFAGIETSANFKTARPSTRPGRARRRSTDRGDNDARGDTSGEPRTVQKASAGHERQVAIQSGGTVTLRVDADLLAMPQVDREWVFEIVTMLEDYEEGGSADDGTAAVEDAT
jgi:hypothetical protein